MVKHFCLTPLHGAFGCYAGLTTCVLSCPFTGLALLPVEDNSPLATSTAIYLPRDLGLCTHSAVHGDGGIFKRNRVNAEVFLDKKQASGR